MDIDGMRDVELSVNVIYDDECVEIKTYDGEYRNLMTLIADHIDVESFGECGGMGRCATCMAEVMFSEGQLPTSDRNEYATLMTCEITDPNIRLTCQLPVDEIINNIKLRLLNT
ncbi:2Fe-2S ferredoxin [Pedobacter sp. UYP30]|uniref:ferredoxin n=1 Tax=Pedobacter sp. UYP30 TaxID=1756400 RepID=UPI0033941252